MSLPSPIERQKEVLYLPAKGHTVVLGIWLSPRFDYNHTNTDDTPAQAHNNTAVKKAAPRLTDVLKGGNERANTNGQGVYGNESSAGGMKIAHTKKWGEEQSEWGRVVQQYSCPRDDSWGQRFLEALIPFGMRHERCVEDKHRPVPPVPCILERFE